MLQASEGKPQRINILTKFGSTYQDNSKMNLLFGNEEWIHLASDMILPNAVVYTVNEISDPIK
jgi:hypothetical protein